MKKIIYLLSALIIFGLGFSFNAFAANKPVTGYAWSENIGWIDFSPAVHGGVYNDSVTGNMTGYAWSPNIGWVDFDLPIPAGFSPTYSARVDLEGANMGEVSGWARVLAHGGGWDGWIKMRGVATDPAATSYGVFIDATTGHFSGWAWSNMVVGWISFNHADPGATGGGLYRVEVDPGLFVPPNVPPTVTPIAVDVGHFSYCGRPTAPILLTWTFTDPEDPIQKAYQVQVHTTPFPLPAGVLPMIDSGKVYLSSTNFTPLGLSFATTYYWRIKVWDQGGLDSGWVTGVSFTTLGSPPRPAFTFSPDRPVADEKVTFTNTTDSENAVGVTSWRWDFGDGTIINVLRPPLGDPYYPVGAPVTHTFADHGDFAVRLTAIHPTHRIPYCFFEYTTRIEMPLPEWWEVAPFGLWRDVVDRVIAFVNNF